MRQELFSENLVSDVRKNYFNFICQCDAGEGQYRLTTCSEPTPYALCFAVFGLQLLQKREVIKENSGLYDSILRDNLSKFHDKRIADGVDLYTDKAYLQLLTFTMSALSIVGTLHLDPLESYVTPLLEVDPLALLKRAGVFKGVARTGNLAMFFIILLIHMRDYLKYNTKDLIDKWIDGHISSMNQFGFWGKVDSMSHLQFQNGYHQYEAMDYFHAENVPWDKAANNVAILADNEGHFAPYPGGGGCYDYDAIYIITGAGPKAITQHRDLLIRTAQTILTEQNADGGFCESHYIRPRTVKNLFRSAKHVFSAQGKARKERLRQSITLLRPKHNRIHTHWSEYSRQWDESDLWDSWFRMLTIARIDVALDPKKISEWGFIDYPGIGFHSLLRHK
jgi:hypothetical protein